VVVVVDAASTSCLPCFAFFSVSSCEKSLVHYIFLEAERFAVF
jgi:hypothetical protein